MFQLSFSFSPTVTYAPVGGLKIIPRPLAENSPLQASIARASLRFTDAGRSISNW
ncbi:hypothetical protein D3C78_1513560 [compost metagenome]